MRTNTFNNVCKQCGKPFKAQFTTAKFCSRNCYFQHEREHPTPRKGVRASTDIPENATPYELRIAKAGGDVNLYRQIRREKILQEAFYPKPWYVPTVRLLVQGEGEEVHDASY